MDKKFKLSLEKCDGTEGQKWKLENLQKDRIQKF
jgi:hypothetical protein